MIEVANFITAAASLTIAVIALRWARVQRPRTNWNMSKNGDWQWEPVAPGEEHLVQHVEARITLFGGEPAYFLEVHSPFGDVQRFRKYTEDDDPIVISGSKWVPAAEGWVTLWWYGRQDSRRMGFKINLQDSRAGWYRRRKLWPWSYCWKIK